LSYRFGDFLFDPANGLTKRGEPVDLEPRASDLLAFLLENPGRLVSRDELCDKIWDGKVVSDAAISTQVRAVRKALGDDRAQQKYIKTHPRRGVRFVAEVHRLDPELTQGETPPTQAAAGQVESNIPQSRSTLRLPSRRLFASLSVLALAFAGLAAIGFKSFGENTEGGAAQDRDLSIVVMPFDNLSGDASKGYIVDAFTEDLITDLSRIREAFVISRSTSFTFRGKDADAAAVAAELGVRYVLEGSVSINGEKARINARLVDGATSSHLWSARYEPDITDVFGVQGNVTGRIASVLRAELRKADTQRQHPQIAKDAWDYALRGNVLLYNHQSVTDYQEAHSLLSKAVSLDPGISSAWGGLAFVHFAASFAPIPGVTRPDSAELSLEAALKATEADPMNAEPYWLVGAGYARTGQPELGMAACATAMDLNPNMDCGHVCAGLVHMAMGEPRKAVPYFKYALELNPRFRPFTKEKYLGLAYIQSGQDELAIAALNRALAKARKDGFANLALVSALALDGQEAAAREALDRYLEETGAKPPTLEALRPRMAWLGPGVERMLSGLQSAGIAER
jgi:TolB-like protein/DNA-binding winged helix-turn-helix (wHTH) protein/Tfp pilus assembly protein PilF